jgi:selenide,water dikinase
MDDAGVYRLGADLALIQTVDFFTPIVDDPAAFGAIAVANALSDVYAMGGVPRTALNILCYPVKSLGPQVLHEILSGGAAKLAEAEVSCLGGHSVTDNELKFGCAVTGTVHPDRIWRNQGARPGDALVLSKPLGTGILATAQKFERLAPAHLEALTHSLELLNRSAAEAGQDFDIHACTDITGFGLYGHAGGMALASGVSMEIAASALPLLPDAARYAAAGNLTRGDRDNREMYEGRFTLAEDLAEGLAPIVFDPQTSGGLLFAVPASQADELVDALHARGCDQAARIGTVTELDAGDESPLMRIVG